MKPIETRIVRIITGVSLLLSPHFALATSPVLIIQLPVPNPSDPVEVRVAAQRDFEALLRANLKCADVVGFGTVKALGGSVDFSGYGDRNSTVMFALTKAISVSRSARVTQRADARQYFSLDIGRAQLKVDDQLLVIAKLESLPAHAVRLKPAVKVVPPPDPHVSTDDEELIAIQVTGSRIPRIGVFKTENRLLLATAVFRLTSEAQNDNVGTVVMNLDRAQRLYVVKTIRKLMKTRTTCIE
jgi:hypothetical protein